MSATETRQHRFAIQRSDGVWYLGEDIQGHWFSPLSDPHEACRFADRKDAEERADEFNASALRDAELEQQSAQKRAERDRWRYGHYYEAEPVIARTFTVVDVGPGESEASS